MNKMLKRTLNIITIAILVLAMNMVAFAQGTTTIAVSKSTPAVGDKLTISVTATESGTITVKYTSSMLTYESCNASGCSASGNTVSFNGKNGDIVFTAASAGTASIIVSSTTCSGSSTTVAVGGSAPAAQPAPQPQPQQEAAPAEPEPVQAEEPQAQEETEAPAEAAPVPAGAVGSVNGSGGFDINGASYVVSEKFKDTDLPAGFKRTTVKIGNSTYSEPSNGTVTLLYLKPADNVAGDGVFYAYNAEAGTVSEFLMIAAANDCIVLSQADSAPSSIFTPATLDVTGGTANVFTAGGSDFYYVYGTNQAGSTGWFVFDSAANTVSRLDESILSAVATSAAPADSGDGAGATKDSSELYIKKLDKYRKILMGLIVLCVLLVFVIISGMLKHHDKDDFDGDVFAHTPSKPSRKKGSSRSIVFTQLVKKGDEYQEEDEEEYDEEEYDEEYDEDDYEEEEEYDEEPAPSPAGIKTVSGFEKRRSSSINMMDLNDL